MRIGRSPKLPINRNWIATGKDGETYLIDVSIKQTDDKNKYPPIGVKSVFRVLQIDSNGEQKLVILIDNHKPFGFHEHDKLPEVHDSREEIHTDDWQGAWTIFEERIKELLT
ncbi:hypothetical protein BMS_1782 [Halobacteriovorax marinus SJ]|uniref:Uncharacterized protein n=1 Tax=Halobacteriovorax marinus (strain ATCC BAA-682 / DSM 15412 / SJ) TaxID=862908 RepID=E1X1U7_HALMS|nr:hypothetical protein [Halobacteriovorax marinus]CBW26607.1 hypothetical protein BMS_1782 [Halobacteriovorax marinus SJ]